MSELRLRVARTVRLALRVGASSLGFACGLVGCEGEEIRSGVWQIVVTSVDGGACSGGFPGMRLPDVGDTNNEIMVVRGEVRDSDAGNFTPEFGDAGDFTATYRWAWSLEDYPACESVAEGEVAGTVVNDGENATASRRVSVSREGECGSVPPDTVPCEFGTEEEWAWLNDFPKY